MYWPIWRSRSAKRWHSSQGGRWHVEAAAPAASCIFEESVEQGLPDVKQIQRALCSSKVETMGP